MEARLHGQRGGGSGKPYGFLRFVDIDGVYVFIAEGAGGNLLLAYSRPLHCMVRAEPEAWPT